MAVTAHVYPTLDLAMGKPVSNHPFFTTDTLQVLLIASGTYTWNATSQGHTTVTNFLAGSGSGALTEVSGGNYSRQTLASVTYADSGLVTTLSCANPSWANATFAAVYAAFFNNSIGGTDATNQLICYWDFGGSQSVTAATFTLTVSGTGLVTWTAS
jgi:hypothetical protein